MVNLIRKYNIGQIVSVVPSEAAHGGTKGKVIKYFMQYHKGSGKALGYDYRIKTIESSKYVGRHHNKGDTFWIHGIWLRKSTR